MNMAYLSTKQEAGITSETDPVASGISGILKSDGATLSGISGTSSQFVKGDGTLDSNVYGTGTIGGAISAPQVAFAASPNTIAGNTNLTWDNTNFVLTSEKIKAQSIIQVENATGSAIAAGSAVYVSAIGTGKPQVALADADDAAKMPSVGIVTNQIGNGASGYVAINGQLNGLNRTTASGPVADADITTGDIGKTLYVSTTAGKLTVTRPTGTTAQVQNVGRIIDVNGSNFKMQISNIGRANDVPNEFTVTGDIEANALVTTGGASTDFVKGDGTLDSNTYVTAAGAISAVEGEATLDLGGAVTIAGDLAVDTNTLFVDVSGSRVGIGIETPATPLHVKANQAAIFRLQDSAGDAAAANVYMEFYDEDSRMAYLGFGSGGNADFTINNQENGSMRLYTNDQERMTIYATGNVAVNTNLEVDGGYVQSARLDTVAVSGGTTLTLATHAGRYLFCSGNVTLPASATAGDHYTILNTTGGDITVGRNGNNINGAAADATVSTFNGATAISIDGSNWIVLGV